MGDISAAADHALVFSHRYCAELDALAAELAEYQRHLGGVAARLSDEAFVRAQALDELVQRATELADVARRAMADPVVDSSSLARVLEDVRLSRLAARLAGIESVSVQQGGDLDLF